MALEDNRPADWRERFSRDQVIQRARPTETHARLANPHKGTTTFQRMNGDPLNPGLTWNDGAGPTEFGPRPESLHNPQYPDTTVSYCRWTWQVMEPEKGRYRWDVIDGALAAARDRGQTLQVRMQPFVGTLDLDWFWATGAPRDPDPRLPGRTEPDHNDPRYIEHWSAFIRAFGARYDGHPDLESFDVAYGGSCGEEGGNAAPETAARLVDAYIEAFRKTPLILMVGTHGCRYAAPLDRRIGWRYDCHGDLGGNGRGVVPDGLGYNNTWDWMAEAFATSNVAGQWRTAPVVLETCWTVGHWYKEGWDIDLIIDLAREYHPTYFMPKSSYIPEPWRERIEAMNRRLGYRLVLRQMRLPLEARRGGSFETESAIDNVGWAPLYRDYAFAYRFRQGRTMAVVTSAQDARTWLPGPSWFREEITLPAGIEPGRVNVDCAIVDRATGAPRVRLAIEEILEDGWHPVTVMDVV